jgi:nitrate reductase NapE component
MEKALLSKQPVLVESDEVQASRTKSELVLFHVINCLYVVVSANFTFTAKTWP